MNLRHPIVTAFVSASARAWTILKIFWHSVMDDHRDMYRPEAHYMRGPGPKWREKRGSSQA